MDPGAPSIFDDDPGPLREVPGGDWIEARRPRRGAEGRGDTRQTVNPAGRSDVTLRLRSDAFEDNERIPDRHTCEGEDVSPPLSWEGVPGEAESLALVVDDPDAPGTTWVHWVVYRLDPERSELPGRISPTEELGDGYQGVNDFGNRGWGGPCPPPGDGEHRYRFRLLALDEEPALGPGATKEELLDAVDGHLLEETLLTGTCSR